MMTSLVRKCSIDHIILRIVQVDKENKVDLAHGPAEKIIFLIKYEFHQRYLKLMNSFLGVAV